MVAIVIIDKTGNVKSSKITNENDLTQLYKKAGFKTVGDFEVRTSWKLATILICQGSMTRREYQTGQR